MISELSPACVVRDRHAQSGERLEFDQDDKERKSDRLHCDWEPPGRGRHHREASTCGSVRVLTLSQGCFHAEHSGSLLRSWSPFSLANRLMGLLRVPPAVSRGSRGGYFRPRLASVCGACGLLAFRSFVTSIAMRLWNCFAGRISRASMTSICVEFNSACEPRPDTCGCSYVGGVSTGTIPRECMSLAKCCAAEQSFS